MKNIKGLNEYFKGSESYIKDKSEKKFSKRDLFNAFSYYAFMSVSNKPYNKEELKEQFNSWFNSSFKK